MDKDFSVKVTKTKLLKEVNNDMVHNYYYLVYVRIYNKEHTRYKKAHFIILFDAFDIQEFYEQEYYTSEDVKNYLDELIFGQFISYINSFEDTKEFYELCKYSLEKYL